jgi:hypothetical protein
MGNFETNALASDGRLREFSLWKTLRFSLVVEHIPFCLRDRACGAKRISPGARGDFPLRPWGLSFRVKGTPVYSQRDFPLGLKGFPFRAKGPAARSN